MTGTRGLGHWLVPRFDEYSGRIVSIWIAKGKPSVTFNVGDQCCETEHFSRPYLFLWGSSSYEGRERRQSQFLDLLAERLFYSGNYEDLIRFHPGEPCFASGRDGSQGTRAISTSGPRKFPANSIFQKYDRNLYHFGMCSVLA